MTRARCSPSHGAQEGREWPVSRRSVVAGLAATPFAVPAFVRSAWANDVVRVACPQKGAWDTMITVQGDMNGFFKKAGIDVDVTYTAGGSDTIQVVATRGVDIAMATGTTAAIGAYAHGAPIRILSAENTGQNDIYWYVKASSPIKSFADMNGKSIGFTRPGSSSFIAEHLMATNFKVSPNFVSSGEMPATRTMVMSNQLDAGWAVPPTNFDILKQGQIRIIARGSDVPQLRGQTTRVNIVNAGFLSEKRELATRFLKVYLQTIDWMYAHQDEALKRWAGWNNVDMDIAHEAIKFFPKSAYNPGVLFFNQSLADALTYKAIDKPLTLEQQKDIFAQVAVR
jgi:NitT/TauT family transport system substrate-binding protein